MSALEQRFYNTCMTVEYPCNLTTYYIDPCNCGAYFLCQFATSIIPLICSQGTLYNHETQACELDSVVAVEKKLCDVNKPWERCQSEITDADLISLEGRCTGVTPSTVTSSVATSTPTTVSSTTSATTTVMTGGGDSQSMVPTGAIVGGVVAALLVIVIVVVALVIYNKRRQVARKSDDPYAEIRDVMNDPTYKGSTQPSPAVPVRPSWNRREEDVAYDNPGYRQKGDDDDDVTTGQTSVDGTPSPDPAGRSHDEAAIDQNSAAGPAGSSSYYSVLQDANTQSKPAPYLDLASSQ